MRPKKPSSAGSRVSDASTVVATANEEATATPYRKDSPRANRPSRAMHTVIPAKSTARPEVSIAVTVASSGDLPSSRPCR